MTKEGFEEAMKVHKFESAFEFLDLVDEWHKLPASQRLLILKEYQYLEESEN